eukprot:SAG11_NODE_1789_length_4256_cov_17.829444_1_plen_30_part_00
MRVHARRDAVHSGYCILYEGLAIFVFFIL